MQVGPEAVLLLEQLEHRLDLVGRNHLRLPALLTYEVEVIVIDGEVPLSGLIPVVNVVYQADSSELVERAIHRGRIDRSGVTTNSSPLAASTAQIARRGIVRRSPASLIRACIASSTFTVPVLITSDRSHLLSFGLLLQAVATREDSPNDTSIAYWNDSESYLSASS